MSTIESQPEGWLEDNEGNEYIASPCLFCGSQNVEWDTKSIYPYNVRVDNLFRVRVVCLDCEAKGPWGMDEANAIDKWEERP